MKKIMKVFTILLMSVTIIGSVGIQAHAQIATSDNNSSSVIPFADIIEWKYKVENGKMYKRLYNHTKQVWIGEWVLVS